MSIIQKIREKGALISAIIIALALLGFIAMDALTGRSSLFGGGPSTTVGRVNGKKIEYAEFSNRIKEHEMQLQQQYGASDAVNDRAIQNAWQQEVDRILVTDEINKLGIRVSEKELSNSILFGANPPADLKQQFTDESGQFNAQLASQQINATLKSGSAEQKAMISNYIMSLKSARMTEKYVSMLLNSINFPKWLLEKQLADNSQMASISLVKKLYSEVPDTTIKISDDEIEEYVRNHKNEFKQKESRSIAFVRFSAAPSGADSAAVLSQMETLKNDFANATDADAFVAANSASPTKSIYAGKSMMQMDMKDSIQKLPVNAVLGPYIDGESVALSKMLDIKQLPDSVKCRHVLISANPDQGGFPDSIAKIKIDSVKNAINAGASWDEMVQRYNPASDASRQNKGEMTFSSAEIQDINFAKEFAQFILFDGKPGQREVVKTSFGYHYIEIMNFVNVEPHYKVAHVIKPILASAETEQAASSEASKFAANSRDEASFNANYEKDLKPRGYTKGLATDITPASAVIQQLGISRPLVRSLYDADRGDVLQPVRVNRDYVVAVVTEVNEDGTMPASKARSQVEPLLRNRKKAEQIKKQVGTVSTLEAASSAFGGKPIENYDSVRIFGNQIPALAREQKVIGASFNLANQGKVVPEAIEGSDGVYVVKVNRISTTPQGDANVEQQRKDRYMQALNMYSYMANAARQGQQGVKDPILGVLEEAATIKDNRAKHF